MSLPGAGGVWAAEVELVVVDFVFGGAVVGIKEVDFGVVVVVLEVVVAVEVPWGVVVEIIEGMVVESKHRW